MTPRAQNVGGWQIAQVRKGRRSCLLRPRALVELLLRILRLDPHSMDPQLMHPLLLIHPNRPLPHHPLPHHSLWQHPALPTRVPMGGVPMGGVPVRGVPIGGVPMLHPPTDPLWRQLWRQLWIGRIRILLRIRILPLRIIWLGGEHPLDARAACQPGDPIDHDLEHNPAPRRQTQAAWGVLVRIGDRVHLHLCRRAGRRWRHAVRWKGDWRVR